MTPDAPVTDDRTYGAVTAVAAFVGAAGLALRACRCGVCDQAPINHRQPTG